MSRNMNYSHEMKLEQVRNTFGTTHGFIHAKNRDDHGEEFS
jgi:hypothetical protein